MRSTLVPGPRQRRADPARWLRDALRGQILAGVYGASALPSEYELGHEFGVSRNVVRESLRLLRVEGLVERIPGAGTFVVAGRAVHGLDRLRGLAESFPDRPGHPGRVVNEVLVADVVEASSYVSDQLELPAGAPVVFIERLRRLDRAPLSLDASYLPADLAIPLLDADLVASDVFGLLEGNLGLELASATLSIDAVGADESTARLLGVGPGDPLLLVARLSRLGDGRPVDLEFVRYRGDRLSLTTRLTRRPDEED
jgi:GntR family transcriptional regulator